MKYKELRQEIINTARLFNKTGLSIGTSGNLSIRVEQGFLITPTGVSYDDLQPEDIVMMDLQGNMISGELKPSSEWRFHKVIFTERHEINAIVHVHSPYATGIACTRDGIPAFHYMVAIAGGNTIRCARYATFGTEELSANAIEALKDRRACLLANHGMIALGVDIQSAFNMAREVETLAHQYWVSKQFGEPVLLDEAEMSSNLELFRHYGKQDSP